jgi:hypothetical protein
MEKVFHFDSEGGLYRADAAVIYCFDSRFTMAVNKFLKRRGLVQIDIIRIAGGPKALASPREEGERTFALDQLRLSRKLHATGHVILISHSDCAACGGLALFDGNSQAEAAYHRAELDRAAACVRSNIPELTVECLFLDFTGMWRVEAAQSTGSD